MPLCSLLGFDDFSGLMTDQRFPYHSCCLLLVFRAPIESAVHAYHVNLGELQAQNREGERRGTAARGKVFGYGLESAQAK